MYLIDWLIVAVPLIVVLVVTVYANRYLKDIADFMAGGRLAGRYLLATARSEMGAGAIAYVAMFEWFSHGGFSFTWWNQLSGPVGLLIAVSGFIVYRYRQTRALTLAQFFEMRYNRKFRLFTGLLAFIAGLLNFGVIPVVGGKFMVYFLDLPQQIHLFSISIPTYLVLMGCFLTITTAIAITGGQITIMVSDCIQGMFSQIFYVIIGVVLVVSLNWPQAQAMLLSRPPGYSMVNPFDSFSAKDFNIWYVLMLMAMKFYTVLAWQNNAGFNSAASSAHESRMGNIVGGWRGFALGTTMLLLAISSMTYLYQPEGNAVVQHRLSEISDPQTAEQMKLPIGLAEILPPGVKGLFVSIVLMGIFSGDGQALHSWGSILIQDVVLPLRKRRLSTRAHIILLRLSIIGVALFAFIFGALFTQTEYLPMWFNVTMAIYVGGAGSCIVGGLYWSRATTAGAWAGLLTGSILSLLGIFLRQPASVDVFDAFTSGFGLSSSPFAVWIHSNLGANFPLNGTVISFFASILSIAAFTAVSFLTCRVPHDMDRLLHRGKYAVEPEAGGEPVQAKPVRSRFHLYNLVGLDEHFTRSDRWVALGIFFWSMFWALVFVVGSICYLVHPWSSVAWTNYWLVTGIYLPLVISVLTTIWFTIGCWNDLIDFFRRLRTERVDHSDDGTVEPH